MNEREERLQRQLETAHSALNEECATVAALRQQLAEARAEVERLVEERERTINELHDAADELSCPHVHGIETVDGKAEAVWLGAMVAKQLRVNAERNGVERGEVAKLLEDNWRLYKQQLAAQAAELERLRETEGMLIEVYRHVGNSSPKRHALPPGLRDKIRDYTKANCAERAGWLPDSNNKGGE